MHGPSRQTGHWGAGQHQPGAHWAAPPRMATVAASGQNPMDRAAGFSHIVRWVASPDREDASVGIGSLVEAGDKPRQTNKA
jgi:hypothetical protein